MKLRIDPHNPFENPTECRAYTPSYRAILPQITIPEYVIPLEPPKAERRSIRRYYNAVGLGALLHLGLSQIIFSVLLFVLPFFFHGTEATFYEYMEKSSILTALNGLGFLIMNVGVAWIGCKATKVPLHTLVKTQNLNMAKVMQYIAIGIFIQFISGIGSTWITELLEGGGVAVYAPEIDDYSSARGIVTSILYGCIVAPVTEELLYRGFYLKNLSRVSQRTGIFVSALLFGLGHENIGQFCLAFPLGIFLADIAIRHNSILPGIFVHIAVNSIATLFSMGYEQLSEEGVYLLDTVGNIGYMLIAIVGGLGLWRYYWKRRLPMHTPKQSYRGFRLLMTSPWLVLIIAAHIFFSIDAIMQMNMAG